MLAEIPPKTLDELFPKFEEVSAFGCTGAHADVILGRDAERAGGAETGQADFRRNARTANERFAPSFDEAGMETDDSTGAANNYLVR